MLPFSQGDFYERLNELQRALDSYIRGNAFRKAVELARKCFPFRVVELQEHWGDYLVSQKQIDMAINHYIEAKVSIKMKKSTVGFMNMFFNSLIRKR
jgi:intraflagellar transport protein 172